MRNNSVLIALALSAVLGWTIPIRAEDLQKSERAENAGQLIKNAQEFKLKAARYHKDVQVQNKTAAKLKAEAKQLGSGARKLNAAIEEKVRLGTPRASDLQLYKTHIAEFDNHSKLYNQHLADYEKQILKAEAAAGQLRSTCSQYADHAQKYHIPGIRPPHICVQLKWEQQDMQRAARVFQEDQIKSQKAEAELAKQEAALALAVKQRAEIENKLLQKANLDEIERTQGVMLLKEYQAVEREYRILQEERKRLEKR